MSSDSRTPSRICFTPGVVRVNFHSRRNRRRAGNGRTRRLGDFRRAVGIHHGLAVRAKGGHAEFDKAHAAVADDRQLGMIAIMRHVLLGEFARLNHRGRHRLAGDRIRHRLRHFDFAPVHLHLDFFDRGGAGFVSVVAAVDIVISGALAANFWVQLARQLSFARRSSSASPFATNSSLNFATKLCTGQEQASPKAQMVRPPGMLSAIFTR